LPCPFRLPPASEILRCDFTRLLSTLADGRFVVPASDRSGLAVIASEQVQATISNFPEKYEPFSRESLADFLPISRDVMVTRKLKASYGENEVSKAIDGNPKLEYTIGTCMKP